MPEWPAGDPGGRSFVLGGPDRLRFFLSTQLGFEFLTHFFSALAACRLRLA